MRVVTQKVVYIPNGSIRKIITQLELQNYNVTALDTLILRFVGSPQQGWINIGTTSVTKADFLHKLVTAKAAMREVTLIPGETTFVFLNQLSETLHLNRQTLQKYYDFYTYEKEGAFFPNTYQIPIGISARHLITLLLRESYNQMRALSLKIFGVFNKDIWFRYITVASIVQKEAGSQEEMPVISSVIYNRLQKKMKLQMDGSLNYGPYSHTPVTPRRIKSDTTTYNTYKHYGLPKYPVCNVGLNAIRAAIFPAKTKYLYFVNNKKGGHFFSCNFSTHVRNIKNATK
jgi:UPF0755 protein